MNFKKEKNICDGSHVIVLYVFLRFHWNSSNMSVYTGDYHLVTNKTNKNLLTHFKNIFLKRRFFNYFRILSMHLQQHCIK